MSVDYSKVTAVRLGDSGNNHGWHEGVTGFTFFGDGRGESLPLNGATWLESDGCRFSCPRSSVLALREGVRIAAEPIPAEPSEIKLTQTQIRELEAREKITNAITDVLQEGPKSAEVIHSQLKELYGVTSAKLISEMSAEMVQHGLLRKGNTQGQWVWELQQDAFIEVDGAQS